MGAEATQDVRVLVVDDCPLDRKIVQKLLLKNGTFKVSTVDSGKKAIEVLGLNTENVEAPSVNVHKIDLVLTDYCMPQMNGYDLLKVVKESNCLRSIPVVLMSSENDPDRIRRCLDVGAKDFILKPLRLGDIQKLKSYASEITPPTKTDLKPDSMAESNVPERSPQLARVSVA